MCGSNGRNDLNGTNGGNFDFPGTMHIAPVCISSVSDSESGFSEVVACSCVSSYSSSSSSCSYSGTLDSSTSVASSADGDVDMMMLLEIMFTTNLMVYKLLSGRTSDAPNHRRCRRGLHCLLGLVNLTTMRTVTTSCSPHTERSAIETCWELVGTLANVYGTGRWRRRTCRSAW